MLRKSGLASLIIGIALWGAVNFPNSPTIAQNTSAGFPTPEAAFRAYYLRADSNPGYRITTMVYAGEYTMGSWTWGEMGGVAIAKQRGGSWVVVCATGGAFSKIEELQTACGIPYQSAQALLQKWLNAQQSGTRKVKATAYVYDPPSNIRFRPNGDVVCQVTRRAEINIYNYSGGWYSTDYCGTLGYIHESQVTRIQGLNSRSVCNVVGIERGQLALRFAPGGDSRAGLNNGNTVRILSSGFQPWVYVRVVNGPNRQVEGLEGWVNGNYLYCPTNN